MIRVFIPYSSQRYCKWYIIIFPLQILFIINRLFCKHTMAYIYWPSQTDTMSLICHKMRQCYSRVFHVNPQCIQVIATSSVKSNYLSVSHRRAEEHSDLISERSVFPFICVKRERAHSFKPTISFNWSIIPHNAYQALA